jgi:hypothetical protein
MTCLAGCLRPTWQPYPTDGPDRMKHGPDSITSSSLRPRPGVLIVYRRRECWQPQLLDDARQPEAARAEALNSARLSSAQGTHLAPSGSPFLLMRSVTALLAAMRATNASVPSGVRA